MVFLLANLPPSKKVLDQKYCGEVELLLRVLLFAQFSIAPFAYAT